MSTKTKLFVTFLIFVLVAGSLVAFMATRSRAEGLRAGFNPEFLGRPDGYEGLVKAYDFRFASPPVQLQSGRMYEACANGDLDVISAFATDGRIEAYDLKVLTDDRGFFPPYDAVPLTRAEALKQFDGLGEVLGLLTGKINTPTMREMNLKVDRKADPMTAAEVASEFLKESDLLGEKIAPDSSDETIRVGAKNFTEQRILGQMLKQLIEHHTNYGVRLIGNLASDRIFPALQNDELDVYVDYTGTGLMNYLKRDPMSDAQEVYDLVKEEFRRKWDIVWLEPLGFDNSYTLTMRKAQAVELQIDTISDLAEYIRTHGGRAAR